MSFMAPKPELSVEHNDVSNNEFKIVSRVKTTDHNVSIQERTTADVT